MSSVLKALGWSYVTENLRVGGGGGWGGGGSRVLKAYGVIRDNIWAFMTCLLRYCGV